MTERLYYNDPYLASFDAHVVSSAERDGRFEVVLDRTAFYPTSGGQPFDVGTIGVAAVQEVIDRDDDVIVHVVDRQLTAGDAVSGRIDWTRRFDHMQQHTGQHVLSAAYDRLYGVRTESFHLGVASATIDLGREVSADEIRAAEDAANAVVWEDRAVRVKFATAEEAKALPLRKESLRGGAVRLIEVDEFDLSACGGTHVSRTGAIGIIATASWERFRGGTRVEFLCGARALGRFRQWRDALSDTRRQLSVHASELAGAVEKLQLENKSMQRALRGVQEQLAVHEAQALVSRAESIGGRRVLVEAFEGWDASGLKALAAAATATEPTMSLALFNRAQPIVTVVAAGSSAGVDASAVLKSLVARFGGKGGGRRELAQGGGFTAPLDELLLAARAALRN
jgi:alanyl-tRNA synthetase